MGPEGYSEAHEQVKEACLPAGTATHWAAAERTEDWAVVEGKEG